MPLMYEAQNLTPSPLMRRRSQSRLSVMSETRLNRAGARSRGSQRQPPTRPWITP